MPRLIDPEMIREQVIGRLDNSRLNHVEAVVGCVESIASNVCWSGEERAGAVRAAWYHDARKNDGLEEWLRMIGSAGEVADDWALENNRGLLHAQAAAAWAATQIGEPMSEVVEAVRHHPTGHVDWGAIGRMLYVADFCEPGRPFAKELETARVLELASEGRCGLESAAARVLDIRLRRFRGQGRAIHPNGLATQRAWMAIPR